MIIKILKLKLLAQMAGNADHPATNRLFIRSIGPGTQAESYGEAGQLGF